MSGPGYRRLLRWVALPITDRRWAAPLSAVAIGFGLFVGVAIGPGASGTLATGSAPIIEIPGLAVSEDDGGDESEAPASEARPSGAGEAPTPPASEEEESTFPVASAPLEEPLSEEPSQEPEPPDEDEEPEEELLTLKGVVVHANPVAGSYTVAEPSGALTPVHAAKLPSPGTRVSVPLRTLANGTFAEHGTRRRLGTAVKAKLEGTVTYVDADAAAPGYVVSKRGVSVLVRVQPDPAGAVPPLPALGAFAKVDVKIEKPPPAAPAEEIPPATPEAPSAAPEAPVCEGAPAQPPFVPAAVATLWQTGIETSGTPFTYVDFAAVVVALCPGQRQLAISADDLRESGADLLLAVPAQISVGDLEPGDSVLATAEIGEDGALTLAGLASDERTKGADDAAKARGDLVSHLAEWAAPRPRRQPASRSSSVTSASTRAAISSRVARTASIGWPFGSGRSQSR